MQDSQPTDPSTRLFPSTQTAFLHKPSTVSLSLTLSQQLNAASYKASNCTTLPSRSVVSDLLVSRFLNVMKDEIRQLKSYILSLCNLPQFNVPVHFCQEIGRELRTLKDEVSTLQEKLCSLSIPCSRSEEIDPPLLIHADHDLAQSSSTSDTIKLTTWNCRGLPNALPYLNHLIDEKSDVIIISEHWQ